MTDDDTAEKATAEAERRWPTRQVRIPGIFGTTYIVSDPRHRAFVAGAEWRRSLMLSESTPNSEENGALRSAIGGVLFNVSNFPKAVQVRLLGQDMAPLRRKLVDAVLAAGYRRQETETQYGVRYGEDSTIRICGTRERAEYLMSSEFGDTLIRREIRERTVSEWVPVTDQESSDSESQL